MIVFRFNILISLH
ncbi:hypothetical protein BpHYR1_047976 [Brachionus plicatilis]|uniref:Uncharacterized protein n=1 Tax=Brachionus plicatilis TaxID=10195 RepID=A0A3M7Q047_BRAPC|nr:hypothetical protein BpHYR1_047976 [Brachionus plicatilis]